MREVDRRSKYDRRVFLKGAATAVPTVAIATSAGTQMIIASGRIEHPLQAIADGGRDWFNPADVDGYRTLVEKAKRIFAVGYEQLAALFGLRTENLLDAALADDRVHPAAEPEVGFSRSARIRLRAAVASTCAIGGSINPW